MGLTGQLLSQASFSDPAPQALGLHRARNAVTVPFPEESWGASPALLYTTRETLSKGVAIICVCGMYKGIGMCVPWCVPRVEARGHLLGVGLSPTVGSRGLPFFQDYVY